MLPKSNTFILTFCHLFFSGGGQWSTFKGHPQRKQPAASWQQETINSQQYSATSGDVEQNNCWQCKVGGSWVKLSSTWGEQMKQLPMRGKDELIDMWQGSPFTLGCIRTGKRSLVWCWQLVDRRCSSCRGYPLRHFLPGHVNHRYLVLSLAVASTHHQWDFFARSHLKSLSVTDFLRPLNASWQQIAPRVDVSPQSQSVKELWVLTLKSSCGWQILITSLLFR